MNASSGPQAVRLETLAAVILALAAVATAWSGYQASRWHGEQAIAFSHANASRVESTRASDLANTQTEIDVATFSQGVDAYARHETRLADFYRRRFRAALFFGGISTRLERPRPHGLVLGVGCAVLVGTLAWVVTLPLSMSI